MALSKALANQFEAFWGAYPRRPDNPKAAAREVFARRVREGAAPAEIVAAAGRYAASVAAQKLDAPFIPHARTWLSQRRYEDYPEVPASADTTVQPNPEHPLRWLRAEIGDGAWGSWISRLQVDASDAPICIAAATRFALDHVRKTYGDAIEARLGPVVWAVQQGEASCA